MENRLKERLTGAAILVALIVLLVPEMFHGQRREVAANAASSGEGPPLRSYTIDLSNGPARTAPLQATPPSSSAESAAAVSTPPTSAPPTPMPSTSTAPPAPVSPSAPPSAASGGARTSAPAAVSKTPGAAASAAASAHAGAAAWSVQLGLFAQRDNADRLMHSAQTKGFAVGVSDRDAKGLYHVQVGGLGDRAAAQAVATRLRDQGFAAALVAPQAGAPKLQR
jgi:DedD protein